MTLDEEAIALIKEGERVFRGYTETRSKLVASKISPEALKYLEMFSYLKGQTYSTTIYMAIDEYIKNHMSELESLRDEKIAQLKAELAELGAQK